MKKILIIIASALAIASCGTLKPTPRTYQVYFSDYRSYSEDGFLISPNPYTYGFESIGELHIEVQPAIIEGERESLYEGVTIKGYVAENIPYDDLVDIAVNEAKSRGADALVNFSITTETANITRDVVGYIYHIDGYCIKRK